MNQLMVIALGGAFGSVLRYLVSSGVYQWLGREFPYGTLTVNVIGSFLMGLMTEALILQRVALATEYRLAILVGLFGGFTTFSSFSLETLALLEQGQPGKAALNIFGSIVGCLIAVWAGVQLGKLLFLYSGGVVQRMGWLLPFALIAVNAIGAFLIGIVATILVHKVSLDMEFRATLIVIMVGTFLTLSGLYLILYLLESGHAFQSRLHAMLAAFFGNVAICAAALWLGLWAGKQI